MTGAGAASSQGIPVRTVVLLLASALLFLGIGCAAVKPWEKAYLAKKPMQLDPYPEVTTMEQIFLDAREGSAGGYEAVGGGCGCN